MCFEKTFKFCQWAKINKLYPWDGVHVVNYKPFYFGVISFAKIIYSSDYEKSKVILVNKPNKLFHFQFPVNEVKI